MLQRKSKQQLIRLIVEQQNTINGLSKKFKQSAEVVQEQVKQVKAHHTYHRLTNQEVTWAKMKINEGEMTYQQIADTLHCHKNTISCIRRQTIHRDNGGIILRPYSRQGRKRKQLMDYHRQEIYDKFWSDHSTIQELAEEYDLTEFYVYQITRESETYEPAD